MKRFTGRGANQGFTCRHCGAEVPPLDNGSYRNHCPRCLYSLHVDILPGDRASHCGGLMEPVAVEHSGKKGWVVVHSCKTCGTLRRNRSALDDEAMPDDYRLLMAISARPS